MPRPAAHSRRVVALLSLSAAFLAPPKRVERELDVDAAEAREDLAALRRMFPRTAPDAIQAVYVGFAGNFETAVEMLSLALAEERER